MCDNVNFRRTTGSKLPDLYLQLQQTSTQNYVSHLCQFMKEFNISQ